MQHLVSPTFSIPLQSWWLCWWCCASQAAGGAMVWHLPAACCGSLNAGASWIANWRQKEQIATRFLWLHHSISFASRAILRHWMCFFMSFLLRCIIMNFLQNLTVHFCLALIAKLPGSTYKRLITVTHTHSGHGPCLGTEVTNLHTNSLTLSWYHIEDAGVSNSSCGSTSQGAAASGGLQGHGAAVGRQWAHLAGGVRGGRNVTVSHVGCRLETVTLLQSHLVLEDHSD